MEKCDEAISLLVDDFKKRKKDIKSAREILDLTLVSLQYDLKASDDCLLKLEEILNDPSDRLDVEQSP